MSEAACAPTVVSSAARCSKDSRRLEAVACTSAAGLSAKAPSIAVVAGGAAPGVGGNSPTRWRDPQVESAKSSRSHQGNRRTRSMTAAESHSPIRMLIRNVASFASAGSNRGKRPSNSVRRARAAQPARRADREPVAVEQGSRQVKGNPQVLGLAQQGGRALDDRVPVRLLRRYHALPICCSGLPCTRRSISRNAGSYSRSAPQGAAPATGCRRTRPGW